jgi:hypothetical protein
VYTPQASSDRSAAPTVTGKVEGDRGQGVNVSVTANVAVNNSIHNHQVS